MVPSFPVRLCLSAVISAACGTEGARERFSAEVLPVLERRCLSPVCHGVASGAEAGGEVIDRRFFFVDVDGAGLALHADAAYASAKGRINTAERAAFSTLLRKPLAIETGGLPHAGGHPFAGRDEPDFRAMLGWVELEKGGGEGALPEELTPLERQFATEVLPALRDRGCMFARCHGPAGFAGTLFVPPMDGVGGDFSVAEVRANYEAARRNLALGGDPSRSRLLAKVLPLAAGGVLHRGGNDLFFPLVRTSADEDPDARAIEAWASAERDALLGAAAPVVPAGFVFVRGPASPRAVLDLAAYRPGSDLWLYPSLAAGAVAVNLSATAHPTGPADVRDPAVSHDGRRVIFAMRTSPVDCHNLYEIGLDGMGLRQLTRDTGTLAGGGKVVNRFPVYGPGDRIFFVSTRAGAQDETGRALDAELYELGPDGPPLRHTFTPTSELNPAFLAVGEFRGSLAFTVIRRRDGKLSGPIFRFPPDHDRAAHAQPEYHPHHGQTAPAAITYGLRELPDGRDVAVLLDEGNLWEGGSLAVIERQLGPDMPEGALDDVSVPGFRHAVSLPDPTVRPGGSSAGGLYRDPAPLPDGRVILAFAPGPIDLDDPDARPDTGIWAVTLASAVDGAATLTERTLLVDAAGLADDQPAVVMVRPDEDEPHAYAWDPAAPSGRLRHAGVPLIEAVNRGLAPRGAKPIDAKLVAARLVAWAPAGAAEAPAIDLALVANGDPASTWWSNGVHGPVELLGEVPLALDGTLLVEAPGGTAARVQALDADGFARGRQSALWIDFLGGWTFPQGVQPARYPQLCAGCHGALDGDPADALPPTINPDAVTGASITMATYQAGNPRRPLPPLRLDGPAPEGFQFGLDLGPVLQRSCALAGCHVGAGAAGGLDLRPEPTAYYDRAYEALQAFGDGSSGGKRYVDEREASAYGSFLMEKLTGRELGAPRVLDFACPPAGSSAPPLTADEVRAFARWIDMGAIYRTPGAGNP